MLGTAVAIVLTLIALAAIWAFLFFDPDEAARKAERIARTAERAQGDPDGRRRRRDQSPRGGEIHRPVRR